MVNDRLRGLISGRITDSLALNVAVPFIVHNGQSHTINIYNETCPKQPLKNRQNKDLKDK